MGASVVMGDLFQGGIVGVGASVVIRGNYFREELLAWGRVQLSLGGNCPGGVVLGLAVFLRGQLPRVNYTGIAENLKIEKSFGPCQPEQTAQADVGRYFFCKDIESSSSQSKNYFISRWSKYLQNPTLQCSTSLADAR